MAVPSWENAVTWTASWCPRKYRVTTAPGVERGGNPLPARHDHAGDEAAREQRGEDHGEPAGWRAALGLAAAARGGGPRHGAHGTPPPPVMSSVTPVIQDAASEARYSTAWATSAGRPIRP